MISLDQHERALQRGSIARIHIRRDDDVDHAAWVLYGQKCKVRVTTGIGTDQLWAALRQWDAATLTGREGL